MIPSSGYVDILLKYPLANVESLPPYLLPGVTKKVTSDNQAKFFRVRLVTFIEKTLYAPLLLYVSNRSEEAVLTEMKLIPFAIMFCAKTPVCVESCELKSIDLRSS